MSIKSRTIDNLGVEASIRYAKDKALFEPNFIEDSRIVSQKTEISALRPYIPSEFDQLFTVGKNLPWASFLPPPEYFNQSKPLFSYQLIPSLGSYEKQEADTDKLEALEDAIQKHRGSKKKKTEQEMLDEEEEEETERQAIVALLECIHAFDRSLDLINSRRNQYQRG